MSVGLTSVSLTKTFRKVIWKYGKHVRVIALTERGILGTERRGIADDTVIIIFIQCDNWHLEAIFWPCRLQGIFKAFP